MTKNFSVRVPGIKFPVLPTLLAGILFFISTNLVAQNARKTTRQKQPTPAIKKEVPGDALKEYNSIISKYDLSTEKGRKAFPSIISVSDRGKLETLYKKMSKKEQIKVLVGFMPAPTPLPVIVPSDKQLEEWEDANKYEVWIDGKKVSNTILRDYSNTDFSYAGVGKPSKITNSGKGYSKVELMTKEYHHELYNNGVTSKDKSILFVRTPQ